jgi:hypothetical protein
MGAGVYWNLGFFRCGVDGRRDGGFPFVALVCEVRYGRERRVGKRKSLAQFLKQVEIEMVLRRWE